MCNEYVECPFSPRFLIWKDSSLSLWEICLRFDEECFPPIDEYPRRIGFIRLGDKGLLSNATNLGWMMVEQFRNQGIMSRFLELYLNEVCPDSDGFAVVIMKHNLSSLRLALKNGFVQYFEDDEKIYLQRKF